MALELEQLQEEIKIVKEENEQLKIRLKKYTNPPSAQRYYQKNKETANARSVEYMKTVDPEKRKKWNRDAYLRKKQKEEEMKKPI